MKIIRIERCLDCVYSGIGKKLMQGNFYCRKTQEWFDDNTIIQPWCPLEDVATLQDKVIENLRVENEMLRNNGAKLWDGVTDFLDESAIKKIERLYKNELSRFI